jgi:(2Fe-2S) ferredoxin
VPVRPPHDGAFSLTRARCLGSCGLAPMVVINGEVRGKETPESVVKHVKTWWSERKSRTYAQEQPRNLRENTKFIKTNELEA